MVFFCRLRNIFNCILLYQRYLSVRLMYNDFDIRNLLSTKKDNFIPEFDRFFETPNLNVIWGLVAAIRYDFNDPQPRTQFKLLRTFFGEKLAGPITFVSWLRYIFPFSMIYSNIIKAMDSFRILLKHVIEDQRQIYLLLSRFQELIRFNL